MSLCLIYHRHCLIAEKIEINSDALCFKRTELLIVLIKKEGKEKEQ